MRHALSGPIPVTSEREFRCLSSQKTHFGPQIAPMAQIRMMSIRLWLKGGLRPGPRAVEKVTVGARLRIGDVNLAGGAVGR